MAAPSAPVDVELDQAALLRHRHAQAGARILDDTLGLGVAEEGEDGIADELIHRRAVRLGDRRHLGEVLVEEIGQLFRLQLFRHRGEVLDVGEEDRQLRSEEYTSEIQSLMRNSYAVFCLKKNNA